MGINRKLKPGKIACIVLAAGASRRFGSAKQLVRFGGKTLVQHALDVANDSKADYVLLTVGGSSSKIVEQIQPGRALIVLNNEYEKGISTSIISGISNLPDDCAGAILMVADQPFLASIHLDMMIGEFEKKKASGNKRIIVLSQNGEPRNPVLVPRELFHSLLKLKGDIGAREIIRSRTDIQLIEINDPRVFLDVDTKASLSELAKAQQSKQ